MKKYIVAFVLCIGWLIGNAQHLPKFNDTIYLPPVEGFAIKASDKAPFAKTNLLKKDIEKNNLGQDLPFLLNQTPSVVINSDAGNGVGYTGIHIRGTDATRINVTLNGIPYNDAEEQGTYFVDIPDIVSSVNAIQIQRGVGTSTNGSGAFGATINLSTNEFNSKPYGEISNSFGSFNTWKNTVNAGTGLLNNHFTIDTRVSSITSNGFIDRASSNLKSLYLSGAYFNKKSSIRLNIIRGNEKTYQAWNGIPEYKLFYNKDSLLQHYYNNLGYLYNTSADSINLFNSNPRKYNLFTYNNQTDNYQQNHYQFFVNHEFKNNWNLNSAIFLTQGKGYYEEYKYNTLYSNYNLPDPIISGNAITNTDLIRRLYLDNNFYGTTISLTHKTKKDQFIIGTAANEYDGKHYGNIIWANIGIPKEYQWYYHTAYKTDFNVFAKYQFKLTPRLQALADMQYRGVKYKINGTRKFPNLFVNQSYNFFNPKLGLSYTINKTMFSYLSYAVANKEPNRGDFETGTAASFPKREQLHDVELGIEQNKLKYSWAANVYWMKYKDQLVLTGKINDVGDPVRINVAKSYRLGVELQGRYALNKYLQVSVNLTCSNNKITNFNDFVPRYDADYNLVNQDTNFYKKTNLAFSPKIISSALIQINPLKNVEIDVSNKYVGKQFLDNATNNRKVINNYFVQDIKLVYKIGSKISQKISVIAQVNNVWNKQYQSTGYTYSYLVDTKLVTENFYYPMASTNFIIGLNVKF